MLTYCNLAITHKSTELRINLVRHL